MYYVSKYKSILGDILLASDGEYLIGLWFCDQKHFASTIDNSYKKEELEIFSITKKWLNIYFNREKPNFSIPIKLVGTDFQIEVWNELLNIHYGSTTTYGNIAKKLGCKSSRAVGMAIGKNPISIIVPCHRVIGANGGLTGYAGGIYRKEKLLELEKK